MDTTPHALTEAEMTEIASIPAIQGMWGAENTEEMIDILRTGVYAVKFNFHSGSPGYVGDLYILQGDVLTGDSPIVLTRDQGRKLIFAYD